MIKRIFGGIVFKARSRIASQAGSDPLILALCQFNQPPHGIRGSLGCEPHGLAVLARVPDGLPDRPGCQRFAAKAGGSARFGAAIADPPKLSIVKR